jgi:hypothetical protein
MAAVFSRTRKRRQSRQAHGGRINQTLYNIQRQFNELKLKVDRSTIADDNSIQSTAEASLPLNPQTGGITAEYKSTELHGECASMNQWILTARTSSRALDSMVSVQKHTAWDHYADLCKQVGLWDPIGDPFSILGPTPGAREDGEPTESIAPTNLTATAATATTKDCSNQRNIDSNCSNHRNNDSNCSHHHNTFQSPQRQQLQESQVCNGGGSGTSSALEAAHLHTPLSLQQCRPAFKSQLASGICSA